MFKILKTCTGKSTSVYSKLCSTISPGDPTVGDFNFLLCNYYYYFAKSKYFAFRKT